MAALKISNIICGGASGIFKANSESVGWRGSENGVLKQFKVADVVSCEWFTMRRNKCAMKVGVRTKG